MTARLMKQSLVAAALVTVGGNIFGRLFGYLREAVTAGYFGTSAALDLFLIAFVIPEIITFIVFAALPTSIIQTAASSGAPDPKRDRALFWNGLYTLSAILLGLTAALVLFRHQIIQISAPELIGDSAIAAARLLGLAAAVVFFRGIEAYCRAWLFRQKHFVAPALAPIVLDLILIAWMVWGYDSLQVETLAYGWLTASAVLAIIHAAIVALVLKPGLPWRQEGVSIAPLLRMTLAVAAVESASLVFPAIDRYLAVRYLGEGEIAALRYALFLAQVPPGMLVVTFSAAAFPWISDMANSQPEKLSGFYRETLRLVVFVMAPLALALYMFAPEVISVAFRRGAFDQQSVNQTTGPLLCYALGLVFYGIYFYQIRYYYARNLLKRLALILGSTLLLKLVASAIFVRFLGADGLALSTSLAWLTTSVIMTIDLARNHGLRLSSDIAGWAVRLIISSALTGAVWYSIKSLLPLTPDTGLTMQFGWLILTGIVGLVVYVVISFALRMPEPTRVWETLRSRFAKS
jgi:putative peptidoglycan lipid II flippase